MDYQQAHDYIFYEIGEEGYKLLDLVANDNIPEAIELIIKLTRCSVNDAKIIWTDLKLEYGTKETNPFMESSTLSPQQIAHNNAVAREWQNKPKCITCGSTNVKPISDTERAMSVVGLGIFSKKINKTYKCLNCKCTW